MPAPTPARTYAVEQRRGCGCRTVGAPDDAPGAGTLALFGLVGVTLLRRRAALR